MNIFFYLIYKTETQFYKLQCLASASSTIYLWPDDGLVVEAKTCCHLVTLNKINIHNTICVLTCESLLLICIYKYPFLLAYITTLQYKFRQLICAWYKHDITELASSLIL